METIFNKVCKALFCLSMLLIFISTDINAQFGPIESMGQHRLRTTQAKVLDIDGDGDLDVLSNAKGTKEVIWFENLGSGEFAEYKQIWEVPLYESLGVVTGEFSIDYGDLDLDGDLDIISTESFPGEVAWYENDGTGNFIAKHILETPDSTPNAVEVADMDGDGDLDILIGEYGSEIFWLENMGNGEFVSSQLIHDYGAGYPIHSIEAIELSGDGNLDIVVGFGQSYAIGLFMGQGNMEFNNSGIYIGASADAKSIKTADIDNDGDIDIYASMYEGDLRWFENDGAGNFESHLINDNEDAPNCEAIEAIDVNGDGYLDMMVSFYDQNFPTISTLWYESNEGLSFETPQYLSEDVIGSTYLTSGDLSGDGNPDLVTVSWYSDQVSWTENLGGGQFSESHELTRSLRSISTISRADMNGDGKLDFLTSSSYNDKICYYPNEGDGNYGSQIIITHTASGVDYVEAIDFDGDGDLDLFWFSSSNVGYEMIYWMENTGEYSYNEPILLFEGNYKSIVAVDYDLDGDADIILTWWGDGVGYLNMSENTGAGQFIDDQIILDLSSQAYIKGTGDFDNDGDIDFLAAGGGGNIIWFENTGENQNLPVHIIDTGVGSTSAGFSHADLDLDGDLDVVFANYAPGTYWIATYKNLGDGIFGEPNTVYQSNQSLDGLHLIDIQNDGLIDIVANDPDDETIVYLLNNGIGNFDSPEFLTHTPFSNYHIRGSGDLDGDGDQDLFGTKHSNVGGFFTIENFHFFPHQARGRIFLDINENGSHDSTDIAINNIGITSQPLAEYTYSYDDGRYHLFIDGTDGTTYQIQPETLDGWAITTDSDYYSVIGDENFTSVDSLDFGFAPDSIYTDLNVNLTGGFPRCNQLVNYWIDLSNQGTSLPSGVIHLAIDDSISYSNSSLEPDSIVDQNVYWHLDSLFYFSDFQIDVEVLMPSFTSMGDTLLSTLTFTEDSEIPEEAVIISDSLEQILVCAYDPNDKSVTPAGLDSLGYIGQGQELEYLIRFQNTGNDTAFAVIIHDQLASELDKTTFEPKASSHEMQTYLHEDGRIEFSFFNIMLPDSGADFLGSQGYVKFKIQPLEDLLPNTEILNTAEIFFDYNTEIVTNTLQNTIECYVAPTPSITFEYPFLSAGVLDGTSYQWYLNGEVIEGATTATLVPDTNGFYSVEVGDANACITLSDPFDFSTLGVISVDGFEASIYPNPSSGVINFSFSLTLNGDYDLIIYNILGVEIINIQKLNGNTFILPKGTLEKGVFLASVRSNETGEIVFTEKIVVQ